MNDFINRPVPIIDQEICDACGLCLIACPNKAISIMKTQQVIIDPKACNYEGACEIICPVQAISRLFEIIIIPSEEQNE